MPSFGQWEYTCDREATVDAYARAEREGSASCTCNGCRNFVRAWSQVFPVEFLSLLNALGIDPSKDGEVYHNAQLSSGHHDYGGWFHFVGELKTTGDFPFVDFGSGFTVSLCRACAPRLSSLKDLSVVQLEFHSDAVPWMLDEPEAK